LEIKPICGLTSEALGSDPAQPYTGVFFLGNTRESSDSEYLGNTERGFTFLGEVELNDTVTFALF
jgi:hypothetical protein